MDARAERALEAMAAADQDRADLARSTFEWMTGGEGLDRVDLAHVMEFAWYALPLKWLVPLDEHLAVVDAAGELFERLGLDRYAEVFRSSETRAILDTYQRSEQEGFEAFRAAYERSGVDPPDLDDFSWGGVMGLEEATSREAASRALEAAFVAGDLMPGARGWKSTARAITAEVLDEPHPELPVQTRRDAILTERLDGWLRLAGMRSKRLGALRSRHVKRLLHPVQTPTDIEERMAPIVWFLDRVVEGVRLTQAGYLPTAMVREGYERFGWELRWTDRPPRSESEAGEMFTLHEMLRRVGAVRRRGAGLRVTVQGREMAQNLEVAWRTVAAGLSDGDWPRAVAEVFTYLLLDGVTSQRILEARATDILGEVGWRAGNEPLDPLMVSSAWYVTSHPLRVLGGVEDDRGPRYDEMALTSFGEATLIEQIRAAATGPPSLPR